MANSPWSIQKRGFDRVQFNLKQVADPKALEEAMRESLKVVQQEASRFPPQPSRTRAKSFNTWVREVGQMPRSAFGVSRKTGKTTIRRAGRAVLRKSEMLLKKWKEAQPQIRIGGGYIVGRITNAASYGKFVQGIRQARFHAATGWKTTEQIQKANEKRILGIFEKALKAMIAKAGG